MADWIILVSLIKTNEAILLPLAAMVAGESRLGVLTVDWFAFKAATEGFTFGALQTDGDDVRRYFPSCPKWGSCPSMESSLSRILK